MTAWRPARWSLRTRVALAYLATTGVALLLLGVFVQVRVASALEERLKESVGAEVERLEATPTAQRADAVRDVGGELHAQLLTGQGDVAASSLLVTGPLLGSAAPAPGWTERTVTLLDDDAAARGEQSPEQERLLLRVAAVSEGFLVVATSREDADDALAALRRQLLLAGPLALAVAGFLGYLVAGAGLRPIERIRARAATISARSAGERLPVPTADDELHRLALTLNAMLERLDEGLQRERRFVAEASHDLRTPLALMRTELDLALSRPRTAEETTDALRSVHDEVLRMISLADDLLERAGAGGVPLEVEPVDLADLAHRVAARFQSAAGDRAVKVRSRGPVFVVGDANRLDRALSNLVDNAVRHGSGEVSIDVRDGADGATAVVSDGGTRAAPDTAGDAHGGAGIGLSIVREIAHAHGGTLTVSTGEDLTTAKLDLTSP